MTELIGGGEVLGGAALQRCDKATPLARALAPEVAP